MEISCQLGTKGVLLLPIKSSFTTIKCGTANTRSIRVKTSVNLYEVLSLESEKVGYDEIKKAYRSMARQYHPDVAPVSRKEESTRRFVELQKAYETLSDPVSRQKYDHELRLGGGGRLLHGVEERTFSRYVWENQLEGLKQRPRRKR